MKSITRKMGLVENLFEILHDLGAMIDVNVARISGELTPDILRQALDFVQKRHPMLQVHIVKLADGMYFESEGTTKIPLRVLEEQYENHCLEIAQDELHQRFSIGVDPLCRITFLRSPKSNDISEIIATFHHAITDGMSCMHFIHELLTYCQQIAESSLISEVVTMPLLPPIENLVDRNSIRKNEQEEVNQQAGNEIIKPKLIIEEDSSQEERRTSILFKRLTKENTISLISRCKQEKTTVHGALCAAMLFAVANFFDTNDGINLLCGSNVSLRKYCNTEINHNYIGCLVSLLTIMHNLDSKTNFWDLARECKSKLNEAIDSGVHIDKIINNNLNHVNRNVIIQMSELNMGRTSTINISNRGQYKFLDHYGNIQLKELYFNTGQHIIGTCFWLGAMTFHEQLFCSFAHVVPLLSSKTAELLAQDVVNTLQKASEADDLSLSVSH
ncbi:MAG: phthiocerol/phthiodiolone dimycocerosyl transferase family protein [Cuspidothrix sp.]